MARFQSFDDSTSPAQGPERIARLRTELARRGYDGFIVPRADEHQSEYVPRSAERLAWLTGFTGSAGTAVILKDKAALVVDGRYTVQASEQVDTSVIAPVQMAETSVEDWVAANLPAGGVLAYDPWLHTSDGLKRLEQAAARAGGRLAPVDMNLIDVIWIDRPAPPKAPVLPHPIAYAGETAASKLERLRAKMAEDKLDALVISDPHNLAWTFNLRGGDVGHTPLPLGYAIVPKEGRARLFFDRDKMTNEAGAAVGDLADFVDITGFLGALDDLGHGREKVRIDAATGSVALIRRIEAAGGKADVGADPVALMKAVKNQAEIAGSRAAHLRDGVAVARFLAWLDREAPKGNLTEIDAVEALEAFRLETGALRNVSFPSISGAGPNAALPHYRVTRSSNRTIERNGIFLIDSGAQYEDGTTDITRTVIVGEPTAEMKDRFTRVLKGHIAIARCVFPKGTSGAQIDAFARQPLWEAGLDFDHGTGHGIGSYLSVHEGPQRIAKTGTTPLEAGMMLSNEPGFYKPGAYGIRIENLILVEPRTIPGGDREMLGFETLTFSPIDLRLVEPSLLTEAETAWLDGYHAEVRAKIGPHLDGETRSWLEEATRPLG
ncbi:aminopeptidase P family protein [Microvirga thermotolerans]|uniref:M24 family metallopeptidase n=1 Tax=Microvirga thermotolerans TaxID=2651334 RepID=A0A5P9JT62_9HYPH|nr:aminopeptidase P family protein [Microvirga thermotolerans]QFU16002.1 M24 family metallopeptidase [Microvirga thermotolerans]